VIIWQSHTGPLQPTPVPGSPVVLRSGQNLPVNGYLLSPQVCIDDQWGLAQRVCNICGMCAYTAMTRAVLGRSLPVSG
jgi:hypothetical protein